MPKSIELTDPTTNPSSVEVRFEEYKHKSPSIVSSVLAVEANNGTISGEKALSLFGEYINSWTGRNFRAKLRHQSNF